LPKYSWHFAASTTTTRLYVQHNNSEKRGHAHPIRYLAIIHFYYSSHSGQRRATRGDAPLVVITIIFVLLFQLGLRTSTVRCVVSINCSSCCSYMIFLFDYFLLCKSYCVVATSMAAQEATLEHNFGMFSIPTTSKEVMEAIQEPALKN
jgi:hypothetical protein